MGIYDSKKKIKRRTRGEANGNHPDPMSERADERWRRRENTLDRLKGEARRSRRRRLGGVIKKLNSCDQWIVNKITSGGQTVHFTVTLLATS